MELRAARLDMSRADGAMVTMDVAVERLIAHWRKDHPVSGPGSLSVPLDKALAPEGERPAVVKEGKR